MHLREIKIALSLFVMAAAFGRSGVAQTLEKQVKATLPSQVVVAEQTLAPGKYTLRETANHVIQVFEGDKMRVEAAAITIDTEDKKPAKETKLVLSRFGNDLYLDKMWIQGMARGYEFPLPEKVKSLQREREESLAADVEDRPNAEGLRENH